MQGSERWRPMTGANNPSARLRAARAMPQWLQARGSALPPPPPPPAEDPPPIEPDYEVIDFPNQPYSNTPMRHELKVRADGRRCDLCGSSAPVVQCLQCSQQNFCPSCDDMYHRHPKRQTHIRKALEPIHRHQNIRPPLPPKGEPVIAPIPPPRRKQRRPIQPPSPQVNERKELGLVGSIRRMVQRPLPSTPVSQNRFSSLSHGPSAFQDPQMMGVDDRQWRWELDRSQRSGSMTALNMQPPGFGPLMQAHSMAQLNCPSCQHHNPFMWNWGDPGMFGGGGGWGGSGVIPSYNRRGSLRHPRRGGYRSSSEDDDLDRRTEEEEEEEEEELEMRRRRRSKGGRRRGESEENVPTRGVLETASNRGGVRRRDLEETMSSRSGLRRREAEETMSNRGLRRRDTEETMSNRGGLRRKEIEDTLSSRGSRRRNSEDVLSARVNFEARQRELENNISNRGGRRKTIDVVEVTPIRGAVRYQEESPKRKTTIDHLQAIRPRSDKRNDRFSDTGRRRRSPGDFNRKMGSSEDSGDELSSPSPLLNNQSIPLVTEPVVNGHNRSGTSEEERTTAVSPKKEIPEQVEAMTAANDEEEEEALGPVPTTEWECKHCTFVNVPGTRVCSVCCKTTPMPKTISSPPIYSEVKLSEGIKNISLTNRKEPDKRVTAPVGTQLGVERHKSVMSTGTSPPPQSISTQTYDVVGRKLKRTSSLADHEWNAPQRSYSRQSLLSDTQVRPTRFYSNPRGDPTFQDQQVYYNAFSWAWNKNGSFTGSVL